MGRLKVALVAYEGETLPDWVGQELNAAGLDFVAKDCTQPDEIVPLAHDADIIWVRCGLKVVTAENIDKFPKLGAVIRTGAGTDNVPVAECTKRGIIVANTPEAVTRAVPEHAIGLLFAVTRCIALQDRNVRAGIWDRKAGWPDWHIFGQTLGLVGFGAIPRNVTKLLSGFQLKVLAYDPFLSAEQVAKLGATKVELDELLEKSDFVSVHTPLTEQTKHLIGEAQLRKMKPKAILINTARGPVVDEQALVRALEEGRIGGAGLDVFEQEPLDPSSPLLKFKNVVVAPHLGGYSDTFMFDFWKMSVEAAIAMSQGKYPRSYVNRDVKPKWPMHG